MLSNVRDYPRPGRSQRVALSEVERRDDPRFVVGLGNTITNRIGKRI